MAGEKILSYKITSDPKDAIKNYDDFVKIVLAGAEKIKGKDVSGASDFAKSSEAIKKSAAEVKTVLDSFAADTAEKAKIAAAAQRDAAFQLAEDIEKATERKIAAEKRLAAVQEEIAGRGGKGPTKKQSAEQEQLQQQIQAFEALEKRAKESALIRISAEETYAAQVYKIDKTLAAQQEQIAASTAKVTTEAGKLATKNTSLSETFSDFIAKAKTGKLTLDDLTGALGKAATAGGPLGIVLGAVTAGVSVLKPGADAASEYATALETVSRAGNLSEKTSAGLILSIKQTGGDFKDAAQLASQFTTRLNEGREAGSSAQKSFERVGVSLADLRSKNADEILLKIADGLLKIKDQEARVRGASEIFGDDDAVRFLKVAESLRSVSEEAEKLGLVLGADAKKQIADYKKQIAELDIQIQAFKVKAGAPAAGILANALDFYLKLFGGEGEVKKQGAEVGGKLADSVQEGLNKKGLTLPLPQPPKTGFRLPTGAFDAEPGNQSLFDKKLADAQAELGKMTDETRRKFEEYGQALGGTAAQVIAFTGATEQNIDALLRQTRGMRAVEAAAEDVATAQKEAAQVLGQFTDAQAKANTAASAAAEAEKTVTAAVQNKLEALKIGAEVARQAGQDEVDIARSNALAIDEITQEQLDAAQKVYDRKIELATATYNTEAAKAGKNAEALQAIEQKRLNAEAAAQAEYDQKALAATQARAEAQLAIEAAAAAKRDQQRSSDFKKIEEDTKDQLAAIDRAAKVVGANQESAARRRLEIRQAENARERQFIEDQLKENNVGVEERKRLSQELADLEIKNRETVRDAESEINDARLADAQRLEEQRSALTDKAKAELTEAIRQLDQSNLSEVEKLQQIGDLKIQLANLDVQRAERALEAAKARAQEQGVEVEKDTEVIRLETELIQLRGAAGDAAKAAADAVVAAKAREKGAIEGVNKGLSETPGKLRETGEAAEATASQLAGALGRIYADFQSFVEKAKTATSANIDAILKEAEQRFKGFTNAVFSPIEFAAFGGLKFLADQALQEAFKSRDRLAEEARRKEQEAAAAAAAQRLADAQREAQAIASEREKIEEASSKKIADLRKQESDLEKETAQKRIDIAKEGGERIAEAQARANEVRVRQAQDEAARLLKIERDLQAAREDSQAQSIQTLEDQRQASLEKQADLEGQLSEAKAKGDKTAQAKIEKELARLKEDQRLAEEQAAAEDRARQTAKNQQELDLELQRIAAIYGSRRDNLRAIRTLEDQGRTDLLNDLKASQTREENAINEHFNQKLTRLQTQLADEDRERQAAYAKERNEADKAVNDAKTDLEKRLNDLQTYHTNRLNEIKSAIAAEKAEYTKAMDDLAKKASEFAKKFGESVDAILDGFKKISDAANNTKLPGGGASSNTSTTGGGGGGSSAEVGPRNQSPPGSTTGGNQTGNQSGGLGTDPGTFTGNGAGTAPKDSRKDSATVLAQFLARVLTFKSEGHQPLKSNLDQLRIMRDGWILPNQDPILPLITVGDYNKGLAAIKQFWTLKNVYEEWRRRRITVSFAIHLIEELVEADFCTASDAAIYTAYMKTQIDDFGKEKFNKRPAFESVPAIAPASTPPPAGLKQAPGPTPIPGPQPQGSDFGTPITGNFGTGQFGNPITGNFGGTNTGQFGAPITDSFQVGLIRGLFGEVKSGKRDTTFAASALVDWFNKKLITRVFYDAAYARLLRYANGDKSALDNFSGANVFGNQVTGGQQFADLTTGGLQNLTAPSAESPLTVQPQQPFNLGGGGVGTRVKRPGALQVGPDQRNVTFVNQIDYVDRAKLRADADKNLVTLLDQLGG